MLQKLIGYNQAKLQIIDDSKDAPGGFIEGYASVFNNVDNGGDVVVNGAFKKTLKERLPNNAIKLVDSHKINEGTAAVIGTVSDAKEDDYGLWFRGKVSSVQRAQDVRTKVKEGILDATSFGYDVVKSTPDQKAGVVYLKELKLYEVSIVIWGMNPLSKLTAAKSASSLPPFATAPVETKWDAAEAVKRVKEWVTTVPEEEWDEDHFSKYGRAFLWSKSDEYELPLVDIIDNQPQYVFAAVQKALEEVRSTAMYKADSDELEATIKSLYERFGCEFPLKGHVITAGSELLKALNEAAAGVRTATFAQMMKAQAREIKSLLQEK